MMEETHRRLTQEIGKALNLTKEQIKLLEHGSVLPDYELGDEHSYPHHKDSEHVVKFLIRARQSFLKNDDECFLQLGIVFHYIQDVWISKSGASPMHSKWEEKINKATLLSDPEFERLLSEAPLPNTTKRGYLIVLKKFKRSRVKKLPFLVALHITAANNVAAMSINQISGAETSGT